MPMTGLHFHPLRVQAVHADGDDALVLTFDWPAGEADRARFAFSPGQYLTVRDPGADLRRSYSICAAPGDALRVGVRRVPGGQFSTWLHDHVRAGHMLEVMPPQGRFGAALERAPHHVLAVAGGSGITPILSILKAHLASHPGARATLLYANRTARSTLFKEELEDLKNQHLTRLTLHRVFSREVMDAPLHQGRLDAAKIADFLALSGSAQGVDEAFICGPHAMNDEVEAALRTAGVPDERIHVERFGLPPDAMDAHVHDARPGDATGARITLVRDGLRRNITFQAGDPSILDAAARQGLDVPYSCKSGMCATCRAKLLQGQVRMDRNFALEKSEVAAGFVLTCQAHPLTDEVVLSFDERA